MALFHLGKILFGPAIGLAAEAVMALFPLFVAHAHYNAKDIPVMVFSMVTLLLLSLALKRRHMKYL